MGSVHPRDQRHPAHHPFPHLPCSYFSRPPMALRICAPGHWHTKPSCSCVLAALLFACQALAFLSLHEEPGEGGGCKGGCASRLAAGRRGCHRAKNGPVSHRQWLPGALEGERAGGGRRGSPGGAGSSPPCRQGAARYRRFLAPRSPRLRGRGPECCGMCSHHRRAELPSLAGLTQRGEVLSLQVRCLGQQRTALASHFC